MFLLLSMLKTVFLLNYPIYFKYKYYNNIINVLTFKASLHLMHLCWIKWLVYAIVLFYPNILNRSLKTENIYFQGNLFKTSLLFIVNLRN